jgi:hypothetical protein
MKIQFQQEMKCNKPWQAEHSVSQRNPVPLLKVPAGQGYWLETFVPFGQ